MTSKSDASKKILGFKYQEMVALIECFEADDNTKVYLECLGDISDKNISTEVKHSIDEDKKLINAHIDFWKTISNIIDEYDTFRFYNKFILHTTAEIKEGSIFESWNELIVDKKLTNIISIKPNDTIKSYYENVTSFDKVSLKTVLNKFEIRDKQKTAREYYKETLCKHSAVKNIIKEEHREPFLCSLLGYISGELINSENYIWEIDINSFQENFRSHASRYQIEDLKFPVSDINVDSLSKEKYHFVEELEKMDYRRRIGSSMNNYLKASDSQIKMIEARNSLIENLENYDADIKDIVAELREEHVDKLEDATDIKESSRRFFDDSIKEVTPKTKIEGVTETRSYYPKGRLLHNVEIKSVRLNLSKKYESK